MAVHLRLTKLGKKNNPFYRIVAIDSKKQRDGEYLELLGTYDPITGTSTIKQEIALKWLNVGAIPTDTVRSLFSKDGIMKMFHEQAK